jgi:predicted lipoprotein with Yx(FWY)xxD motif
MKINTFIKLAVLAIMIVAIVGAETAFAEHHAVKVAQKEALGSYLTDIKGMTLYNFKKDSPGKSSCEGPCVGNWPLFYQETIDAQDGLAAGDFGTITRVDGKKQTTYKGMPLYYFSKDAKPGDTSGQGFKDLWSVAKP